MAYTTYNYYKNTYMGFKIPSDHFLFYSERASEEMDARVNIDLSTQTTDYNTEIQKCNCLIAELLYSEENNPELTSEKTLTYSVTYDKSNSKSLNQKIYDALIKHLGNTGFLFGGGQYVY